MGSETILSQIQPPDWIEIIPYTQEGKPGVIVRTKVAATDGHFRGMFCGFTPSDSFNKRDIEEAISLLVIQRQMKRFTLPETP